MRSIEEIEADIRYTENGTLSGSTEEMVMATLRAELHEAQAANPRLF